MRNALRTFHSSVGEDRSFLVYFETARQLCFTASELRLWREFAQDAIMEELNLTAAVVSYAAERDARLVGELTQKLPS